MIADIAEDLEYKLNSMLNELRGEIQMLDRELGELRQEIANSKKGLKNVQS